MIPSIPRGALKIATGETTGIAADGTRTSSAEVVAAGFAFAHPALREALRDLFTTR